jgi:hypothetical protein
MAYDLRIVAENAETFARTFLTAYLEPAFGARSKTEIDLLVFGCLIDAKVVDPDGPIYDIARGLNITPSRARSLVLNWQLRAAWAVADLGPMIVRALAKTRFSRDGTLLTFGIESPLLREEVGARLKRKGIFADASFSKELVRLPVDAFVEFIDELLDDRTKEAVKATLVHDKQLPDTSFKALAKGVLTKLGEKFADQAGGAIADAAFGKASAFITGILSGNVGDATRDIGADDFPPRMSTLS